MRKKRAITMLVSAAVILLLCGPICLHAQETAERTDTDGNEISGGSAIIGEEAVIIPGEPDVVEMLQNVSLGFEETIQGLLLMEKPLRVMEKADENDRGSFLDRFTARERFEFAILYKYLLLTAVTEDSDFLESMQSVSGHIEKDVETMASELKGDY